MFEFLSLCLVLTVLETHAGKISPGVKFTVISIFFFFHLFCSVVLSGELGLFRYKHQSISGR